MRARMGAIDPEFKKQNEGGSNIGIISTVSYTKKQTLEGVCFSEAWVASSCRVPVHRHQESSCTDYPEDFPFSRAGQ